MTAGWKCVSRRAFPSILVFLTLVLILAVMLSTNAWPQGETTSAIQGQAIDATGAVVSGATVTITSQETGLKRIGKTNDSGWFNFPQLKPGVYSVQIDAPGFEPQELPNVFSGLGQKQTANFVLKVAHSNQTVEVSSEAPIINPSNSNTTTTLDAPALEDLPNPGGDLTYPLQFAPGALINTAGSGNDFVGGTNGYGNVEFNGLPALSNGYIVDGLETNDPLTNLNSGLSTNLVLGLNSIAEVSVNTLSYSVDQGRYGASQVNYVTKSGTNKFHGNLYELWNGSILNAADYFTNATAGNHKPRSNVNHFGGSLGGPILHDRLFFFFDSEWVRIALPIVTPTVVPSPAFQQYVIGQGRRASRFFINDNLAWSHGSHEIRLGTNIRVFRLNDFDFGQGTVPLVTYQNLDQFIYGVASTATKVFPTNANEPFNFLNADFYAQDTWKVSRKLTWTIGLRDTFNSNPLDPHSHIARLRGSFDSISHDVNQPLSSAIQTNLGNLFSSTPLAILQPRTAIAWQLKPNTVLRTGFGLFSDILPGTVADLVGSNPPYVQSYQGGLLGTVGKAESQGCDPVLGCTAIAPAVSNSAVDATLAANQRFNSGFAQGELSCASALSNLATCLPPVAVTAVPSGKLHAPYFIEWSLGIQHQIGTTASVEAQYVGTRAVNQPFLTQVNGYQTVCRGCFAPFPYGQPADPRFGAVTQFLTGANSHYHGLQLTAIKRVSHGLQGQVNYTWSHCLDTVSNGGFLQFSAGGILSPLPGELSRDYGNCDYDIRHNLTAQYVYDLPFKLRSHSLGYIANRWQISGTMFWHSGVPFSVLSTPYSAAGNGILQGSGPQFASLVPETNPYCRHCNISGVTQPGTIQWLNPDAFVSAVDPSTGACNGGDSPVTCQFGDSQRNQFRGPSFFWNDFYLTKRFPVTEHVTLRFDAQFFDLFNHANFGLPSMVLAGIPGRPSTQSGFGALTYTTSPPTGLLGVGLGGDSSPRMIAFQARLEF
jgi:hypothetical protein